MSDDHHHTAPVTKGEAAAKAEARSAEAAAIRRRWITLGEALAVIAVVISALTLWNNWSERAESEAATRAQAQSASAKAQTLVLTATPSDDGLLTLKPADGDQSVQAQTIVFPAALGVAPVQTTGESRVEADWFADALKKAREKAGMADDSRGDEQLPVAITTRFVVDGRTYTDVALYDIGYTISGRWLAGHSLKLRGISLQSRVDGKAAKSLLDARWLKLFPAR